MQQLTKRMEEIKLNEFNVFGVQASLKNVNLRTTTEYDFNKVSLEYPQENNLVYKIAFVSVTIVFIAVIIIIFASKHGNEDDK